MKYLNTPDYKHDSLPCTGVLITNLGTPDAATVPALRRYLAEFLSDPRVIETPKWIWWFILHGVILRIRPPRSAKAYQEVWTSEGSPLLTISLQQQQALQAELQKRVSGPVRVEVAMRYGNPSIASALEKLRAANARRILLFPLYPQYSAATTASTFDAVADYFRQCRWVPELRMINHYHDHPGYIEALANSIQQHWQAHGKPDKLLFSFHGLPKDYFLAGDPYHCECHKTARLVAERLQLDQDDWITTFQSRFGPREWLQPYTDFTLKELGSSGVKSVHVICPGFSADCLETLEEIRLQNRDFFLEAGGQEFDYIPALNDSTEHINVLADIVALHSQGWPEFDNARDMEAVQKDLLATEQRATKLQQVRTTS